MAILTYRIKLTLAFDRELVNTAVPYTLTENVAVYPSEPQLRVGIAQLGYQFVRIVNRVATDNYSYS